MTFDPQYAVAVCVGIWIAVIAAALAISALVHGHWRPDWRTAFVSGSKLAILALFVVVGGESQNTPAQAQQEATTRRVERLEDYRTEAIAKTSQLETIVAQQKEMLAQLIATNARQDERITANSETLQKIAIAADTIKESQEASMARLTWLGGILVTVIIVAGFVLDRVREKRMRNGQNPIVKPIQELEEKLAKSREETNALLKELIEIQSQPRRRIR